MKEKVVIIGAGHNGLVAAFYLARAGLDVQVVEALDRVGGACATEELIPGFRFSTFANHAGWLRPRVVEDMRLLERGLKLDTRGPSLWVMTDNKPFVWWTEDGALREEIARISPHDAEAWPRWNELWRRAADIIGPFVMTEPPTLADLTARAVQLKSEDVLTTILTTSLADLADRYFESGALRNHVSIPHDMGSLHDTGTSLAQALACAMWSFSETGKPAPAGYVRGGMGEIVRLMAEAAQEQGARIRTRCPVKRICCQGGRATGVELASGDVVEARLVISNADPKRTFLKLLDPADVPGALLQRVRAIKTDIAPLKFHCAVSELPEYHAYADPLLPSRSYVKLTPDRAHHERAWDDARHGRLPEAPNLTVFVPSALDASLAPPGKHTVSFWILFAPVRLKEGTWPERREEMAQRLLRTMDRYSPNFRRSVLDYVLLTPHDLEERVFLTDGNINHVDITPSQMLWQRPLPELARYRTPIAGLYLCGAGMHPYGEVSGAPGHNAAHAILRDVQRSA